MAELKNGNLENFEFREDSFELVNEEKKIFDQKFETKATTFIKDAFKRFCKNKSSVVAAFILGILILLAVFVPIFSPYNIEDPSIGEKMLAPKLFESGTGFWDGTEKCKNVIVDTDLQRPADYYYPAVSNLVIDTTPSYINTAHRFGKGGYLRFVNTTKPTFVDTDENPLGINYLYSYPTTMTASGNYKVEITLGDTDGIYEYKLGEYRVLLTYMVEGNDKEQSIVLKDFSKDYSSYTLDLSAALENAGVTTAENAKLRFELKGEVDTESYILIKSCVFSSNDDNADLATISINDANQSVLYALDTNNVAPVGYWTSNGQKNVYQVQVYYCSFVYDTYAAAYDKYEKYVAYSTVKEYIEKGWCEYNANTGEFTKLSDKCPIEKVLEKKTNSVGKITELKVEIYRYSEFGYEKMPKFLFGTDNMGHDLVTKAFKGLRTSLILGICTCVVCFLFGLCWGAVSGYFGGNVDLAMERFCDILGGIPWIVVMTLAILHFGNTFGTFFMALCLTGWMGTAARTRTQFYRFKGREYVLASRTLGASDTRLIFRHILPNALGTIVTGAVLMIPSVIFSESTLAYLNLGLQGVESFGVMLSNNQVYISTDPHLILFPASILALIMISFNLFGNGLRDALNPSLKGSE